MRVRYGCLLLFAVVIGLGGCGSPEEPAQQQSDGSERQRGDLWELYVAYSTFHDEHGQGPADWNEITSYAQRKALAVEPLQRLQDDGYTVTWSKKFDASTGTLAVPPNGSDGPRLLYSGKIED